MMKLRHDHLNTPLFRVGKSPIQLIIRNEKFERVQNEVYKAYKLKYDISYSTHSLATNKWTRAKNSPIIPSFMCGEIAILIHV